MPPLLGDLNGFTCFDFSFGVVALLLSVSDQLLEVLTLERVQNVEEVLSVRNSALWHLGGEEPHELFVSLHHGPQLHH